MKSIMEEASSVSKAIDLAWNRAEKPSQFSVKVLEQPERNMFGLTVKSAKIAIFFEEGKKTEAPYRPRDRVQEKPRPARQEQPRHKREEPKVAPQRRSRPEWTDELARETTEWMDSTLKLTGLSHIKYTVSHSGSVIKFIFSSSPTGTESKDRMLFSSFAGLIMATLRHRHKRHLRNLKVILITE